MRQTTWYMFHKERGVLVYDSTRELLAIDVRQRKGEKLQEAK